MESLRNEQTPFVCSRCEVAYENAEDLSNHLSEHRDLPHFTEPAAVCTKQTSVSASPCEEESERDAGPIMQRRMDEERPSTPPPSKEYLAEGSEHIYRTHTCPKCRRCFKMRSHLQEHLRLHFPDPTLQCPTCKRHFTSKSKLRVHRLREAGEKLHRCHLCEYSAVERSAIRRHLYSMHADEMEDDRDGPSYLCPTCGRGFGQSRTLKAHMKTHNGLKDKKLKTCFRDGCSFQSSQRKELMKHAAEVHGVKAVACRHHSCGAVFERETDMEAHRRTHLAYHCPECDFSCSNKTVFLQHRRHGHAGSEKLSCDFCPFATFNPVEFEKHMGHLHANEKIHRCPQCSYVTSHKRGLKRHVLMHSDEKPHKCSQCDFRCRDESYLSKHMLTHSDDKNFMCAECGYVTKWKHYLSVHMRKHAGDLRYACDQCSYRCHRMDQLNSHKLRHQAKSLICEICAYACKRKYELRNHMLAKHSGEERQSALYNCKYCTYSTCYRQALQNHENCKHTKLKEFRCALCSYSSFSSISLFLHKRKSHGYVPGDKAWLEDYAAKEKERSSAAILEDFYVKSSDAHKQLSKLPPSSGAQRANHLQSGTADQHRMKEAAAGGSHVDVLDVASQEVIGEVVSDGPQSTDSPEEYCTLVLTTLPTTDYQTPSLQNKEDCPSILRSNDLQLSQEKTDLRSNASEDEDYEPLNDTSHPQEPEECPTSEVENVSTTTSHKEIQLSKTETHLSAMRKYDKDQAEAMVREGRVQMLVVPAEGVYRCDGCSYVTSKESALNHHRQTLCHGRKKGHECHACGAQFKQRRGLESHLKKKCPALPRKIRTFVGVSNTRVTTEDSSALFNRGTNSDPACLKDGKELHTPRLRAASSSSPKLRSGPLQKPPLYSKNDGRFSCRLCSFSSIRLPTVERHLSICRKRLKRTENRITSEVWDEVGDGSGLEEKTTEGSAEVSEKTKTFSCPNCAFRCSQKQEWDSHDKRGCMKPGEVQCAVCLFVAKSKTSLARHVAFAHNKEKALKRLRCQHCSFSCKQQRLMAQHVALKHKDSLAHHCRYCPFSTTRRYRLDEHESLHTGLGRHSCDVCNKTFGAVTKLRQHKTRIHDKRPTHFCDLCDFSGYTLDDVRRHNFRCHTGELRHICTHCDARFSSEIALRNHCKRAHQLVVCFSCKQCDYTCSSEAMLNSHQQSEHPRVKCTTCHDAFESKEHLQLHQRTHLPHRCHLCSFATKTKPLLARHLLDEHEEGAAGEKPLKCSTCPFTCRHQLVLEHHLRSHGSKRLYKCTDCEYSTRNKQKITWHIRIHTGEKPYSCEQCSYTCTDPSRLKLHMRVHQEEKKYLCPECGYKCKWATQLKYHMTKHTGEKPYACDQCNYRTNRADALRAHRHTQHCDLRPYVCEKCGKAFKTAFILKTHQRQHGDGRPYICGLCQKAFRWPAGLRHHFLSHTNQQPFCCRLCPYTARQKFQVVKHLRRHHPGVSVDQGVVRDSGAGGLTLKAALEGTVDRRTDKLDNQ
ncbi:zinc finger protein 142 [Pholidichthys leucotaenia]